MWGFWEGAHWRPNAALWKRDWTPTPAAKTYRDLVFKKWWTAKTGKANSEGIYRAKAFYGRHSVESQGQKQQLTLRKNKRLETVAFSY